MSNRHVTLLSAALASAAPASVANAALGQPIPFSPADHITFLVHHNAGSGSLTAVVRIWGFNPDVGRWYDLGPLNNGSEITQTSNGVISYAEPLSGFTPFTRLYAEITSLGGTGTTITVTAVCRRAESATK